MRNAVARTPAGVKPSVVLNADGKPMGWIGGANHQAADMHSQELATYQPRYISSDAAYLPERQRIVSRIQDMARNDGWTASTLNRYVDQAIGASFRLSYMPDHVALGLDMKDMLKFTVEVESAWQTFTTDPRNYVDATERFSWSFLVGLAFRHRMRDGEAFAVMEWLDRPWFDAKTCVRVISPERVSNPNGVADTDRLRAGVEMNTYGAPVAYHIRVTHPGDAFYGQNDHFKWERLSRRTPWGRPIVIHAFEPDDANQTRGKSGLAAVLKRVLMTNKYADAEMQAALINAVLAAYVETPMDAESIGDAFASDGDGAAYQSARTEFHETSKLTLNGARIPVLFPGEKIGMIDANRPNSSYPSFEQAALRYFAASTGQSYEQLSADYSQTNYSSVRAALLESWKFLTARRDHFSQHFCTPIFAAWLEEAIERGVVKLPKGAPSFWKAYAAYTTCEWYGPGRGWVDPVKEATASQIRVDAQVSCEQNEASEAGHSYGGILRKQALARYMRQQLDLPDPRSREIGTESNRNGVDPAADPDEDDNADNQKRQAKAAARVAGTRAHSRVPQVASR